MGAIALNNKTKSPELLSSGDFVLVGTGPKFPINPTQSRRWGRRHDLQVLLSGRRAEFPINPTQSRRWGLAIAAIAAIGLAGFQLIRLNPVGGGAGDLLLQGEQSVSN